MEEPQCKGDVGIKAIYILAVKDLVFDDTGNIVRIKKKYGKFKREVFKIDKSKL